MVVVLVVMTHVIVLIVSEPVTLCINVGLFTVSQIGLHLPHHLRQYICLTTLSLRVFCYLLLLHKGLPLGQTLPIFLSREKRDSLLNKMQSTTISNVATLAYPALFQPPK